MRKMNVKKLKLQLVKKSTQNEMKNKCTCATKSMKCGETSQIGGMINEIVNAKKGVKTVVKIEIEFME